MVLTIRPVLSGGIPGCWFSSGSPHRPFRFFQNSGKKHQSNFQPAGKSVCIRFPGVEIVYIDFNYDEYDFGTWEVCNGDTLTISWDKGAKDVFTKKVD